MVDAFRGFLKAIVNVCGPLSTTADEIGSGRNSCCGMLGGCDVINQWPRPVPFSRAPPPGPGPTRSDPVRPGPAASYR